MPDMIPLELCKIKVDEKRSEQVIIFKEKDGLRFLPVVIGMAEVNAIKLKLSGVQAPRPLTHDLFLSTIAAMGAKLEHVLIDKIEQNTFFAKLILQHEGKEIRVDARPSDAVALALRADAQIYVMDEVLEQAGVS